LNGIQEVSGSIPLISTGRWPADDGGPFFCSRRARPEGDVLELILKGIGGGLLTALIVWLSRRGATLPGILPLFPTFAVIALLVVGARGDAAGFRVACSAGARTIPAYLAFLGIAYLAVGRFDYRLAVGLGLVAWFAVALAMFVAPRWF
jgi:uncharacterized membrane protein (GlpM family)